MSVVGRIHSYESCGTVDGPGIRFILFLQGCLMRCKYCHNRDTWDLHGGKEVTVEELMKEVVSYRHFMNASGGGVTASGGEAILQAEFVRDWFRACKKEGISTCLDTNGFVRHYDYVIDELMDVTDLVLLDLGLGGSTTIGVEICRQTKELYPNLKVLIFTGELLNEKLWVDVLDAGADGICLKSGELLTRGDVSSVMSGKRLVFNQPILQKIVERFKNSINNELMHQEALIDYEIDEYDERFLRHLALGYTKEQITNLRGMPFGVKSLEKRQNELVQKLFGSERKGMSINATRLVVRALELRIIDIDNLHSDEE